MVQFPRIKIMTKTLICFLVLISLVFIALQYQEIKSESLTYDETQYLKIGISGLSRNDYTIDPLASPFIAQLSVLPFIFSNS